jgi:hypothetical protein
MAILVKVLIRKFLLDMLHPKSNTQLSYEYNDDKVREPIPEIFTREIRLYLKNQEAFTQS